MLLLHYSHLILYPPVCYVLHMTLAKKELSFLAGLYRWTQRNATPSGMAEGWSRLRSFWNNPSYYFEVMELLLTHLKNRIWCICNDD